MHSSVAKRTAVTLETVGDREISVFDHGLYGIVCLVLTYLSPDSFSFIASTCRYLSHSRQWFHLADAYMYDKTKTKTETNSHAINLAKTALRTYATTL